VPIPSVLLSYSQLSDRAALYRSLTSDSLSFWSQYILVSSGSASATSYSPYLQMKGKLEDGVKAMSFRSVYILQPGLLMGSRTETRTAEGLTQSLFRGLGRLGVPVARFSVDAEECVPLASAGTATLLTCFPGLRTASEGRSLSLQLNARRASSASLVFLSEPRSLTD
jgi:hypothetical protein